MPSRGGGPPALSPVVIDIHGNCGAAAASALPWLRRRSVKITGPDHCGGQAPCHYSLASGKFRSAHGSFIFNVNGRYVKGGKWYSMLTAPNVSGWEGEMVLTPKSRLGCSLALSFIFQTTVSEQGVSGDVPDFNCDARPPRAIKSPVGKRIRASHRVSRECSKSSMTAKLGRIEEARAYLPKRNSSSGMTGAKPEFPGVVKSKPGAG